MSNDPRNDIDDAVNELLIAAYGPDTGPRFNAITPDKWGRVWPSRAPGRHMTDDECDACIRRYLEEGHPTAVDHYRRLKTYGGNHRLMEETERLAPVPAAPPPAADPAPLQTSTAPRRAGLRSRSRRSRTAST